MNGRRRALLDVSGERVELEGRVPKVFLVPISFRARSFGQVSCFEGNCLPFPIRIVCLIYYWGGVVHCHRVTLALLQNGPPQIRVELSPNSRKNKENR
jgi:hypothetical protein